MRKIRVKKRDKKKLKIAKKKKRIFINQLIQRRNKKRLKITIKKKGILPNHLNWRKNNKLMSAKKKLVDVKKETVANNFK